MHVALVHMRSARMGGTESYLNQVARYLCDRGHEVTVICRSHEEPPHEKVRFVVLRSPVPGAALRILAFARDVERHLRHHAYDLVVGLGRTWTQDVIRLGGGCHATYLERAHAHSSRRFARWFQGMSAKHRVILAIEAKALAPGASRCVVVNSELVRGDVIARYGVDPGRIRLIRNGVDLERFHPRHRQGAGQELRASLGLERHGPILLFLGSNYGRKGLALLLDALPRVRERLPGTKLLVVGADADPGRWKQRARDLGVEDAVFFLGKRGDAEACYGAADLYVLPTRYDSFAYTVLEALACGVPVVVSDAAGACEVVDAGCGAVLPSTAGAEELGDAILRCADMEWRQGAAIRARRVAEENDAQGAAERTAQLFEELAASGG